MDINAVLALIQANPLLSLVAVAFYLYETGRLSPAFQKLIALITGKVIPPSPDTAPGPTPADPIAALIQRLVGLLVKSQGSGNKELEQAAIKILTELTSK